MAKKILALFMAVLMALSLTALADVVWEPRNSFYETHHSQCTYLGRSYYANGPDGFVTLWDAPGGSTVAAQYENGTALSVYWTYKNWGCITVWEGKNREEVSGWVPMEQLYLIYDHISFEEEYGDFRAQFEKLGLTYFYTLIDDAVARVIRSKGGFIWACKNYDGDVMSDMVSTAFGSLAMMTSVLVSPEGNYEYEAAHGTVTQHYYRHLKGEQVSTNPMATLFAWTGALAKRGELDGLPELTAFAKKLEQASIDTIESGVMTGDLAGLWEGEAKARKVTGLEFLRAIRERIS